MLGQEKEQVRAYPSERQSFDKTKALLNMVSEDMQQSRHQRKGIACFTRGRYARNGNAFSGADRRRTGSIPADSPRKDVQWGVCDAR